MHVEFDAEKELMCIADYTLADAARAPDPVDAWGKPVTLFWGPVCVLSEFILPRLGSHPKTARGREPKPPTGRNDLDKLVRALHDSLTTARIIADDGLICEMHSSKRYAALGEPPGVSVEVQGTGGGD